MLQKRQKGQEEQKEKEGQKDLSKNVDLIGALEETAKKLIDRAAELRKDVSAALKTGGSLSGSLFIALKMRRKGYVITEHTVKSSTCLLVKKL